MESNSTLKFNSHGHVHCYTPSVFEFRTTPNPPDHQATSSMFNPSIPDQDDRCTYSTQFYPN
ncbi:hypothetical protein BYT27DRAFT_7191819 [Phlegmacium glaucopus]|nr:hypothetical protein BYT27DRAFT_7191819 [Phlegmacium glaucopus]